MPTVSSNESDAARPARKSSGIVVPHKPKWHQRLLARLIFLSIRAVALTLRYKWVDHSGYFAQAGAKPVIFGVWHNRLALCMIAYPRYNQNSVAPGLAALVSASKDGGFLAAILKCFGVQPVRGSSSRRGAQALLELTTWAERGYDLAITPDGPRGPCYVVQDGVTSLAQLTGLPILPYTYNLSWKIRVKSWDRFQIPLPFSKCEMVLGNPIRISREATDAEREELRKQLEMSLRSLSRD